MSKKNLVQITTNEKGREIVMVRVDKTLEGMMEEKPSSRWNASYWHPRYEELFNVIRKHRTVLLDEHRDEIKSGFRSGGVKFANSGFPYLQVRNVLDTGVDLVNVDYIPTDSPAKQENKKVANGDILLNRSGEGSVGRLTVFLSDKEAYVGGHVYRFSVKGIAPIYVAVFLKTLYGKEQIHRFESGVSGKTEIDLDEILHIEIPVLDNGIIKNIEYEYKKMAEYHEKAMKAKKKNNDTEYKKNVETAEKMLKDLIAKTEAVIRGEMKDVI